MSTRRVAVYSLTILALMVPAVPARGQVVPVSIDTRTVQEPISPYIYGQFIEHLGRCIYGGLWAEMLEDRKFFYPVTGDAPAWEMFTPGPRSWDGEGHPYELLMRSPWMIIGDKSAVSMVSEDPYVGEHTPRIDLPGDGNPGGLMQERLSLIDGRHYTGRIVLSGDPGAAPIEVSLVWGGGASDRDTVMVSDLGASYVTVPLEFTAGASTDNGRLEIVSRGTGRYMVGTVSLMPADNVLGWRAETVALLRELNAPIYRWPGGNFVSGYNWKDGIGDPDRRPPRKNPAWKGIEHNDVGIHEYMDLMRLIDAEPFIAINTGLGSAEAAAAQVEYVNGSVDTPMGRLRAENGHPEPYGVKWFAVGNEMYGEWQLGHIPLSEYVMKHNTVVDAMRAVDPSIRAVGVGAAGDWSREMLTRSADHMDLISEHLYWQNREDLLEHIDQIRTQINRVAAAHRAYRAEIPGLADKDVRIAMDEWNYWYGPNEYGELGVQYFLQDALGIAAGLHTFFQNSDLFYMANYAQTVNVIGAIKTTATEAEFETTGLVLKLYRNHFGTHPVQVTHSDTSLDIAAAMSEDNTTLTVAIINPLDESREIDLSVQGYALNGKGSRWTLTGESRWSHNTPGKPRQVDIYQTSFTNGSSRVKVAPLSVTLFAFGVR